MARPGRCLSPPPWMRLLRRRMGHTEGSASMDGARSSFAIFPLPFSASLVDAVEAANGPSSWSSASWSSNHVHRRTQRKLGQPAMETPDGKPASSEDGDGRDIPYESKDNEGEGSARLGRVVFKAGFAWICSGGILDGDNDDGCSEVLWWQDTTATATRSDLG
ncbi:hypothetical protein OsJ_24043 [Oryza sativa Japonica Group]|uniref:Uncharacterized protein n=2 Tax=Oryza TaxID=4527 RepID=B9FWY6_ORYSJ|nr:hypothetical protein OsJ_24043 [Oryza sativa Japonica Group]